MVPWKPPGGGYQDTYFIPISQRLYRDRIIVLGDFLDEQRSNNLIATLLYLKQENKRKQISLYINIPGALMKPTMAVYDTLMTEFQETPIMTVNLGLATGMAAFLCAAGTRGKRCALPNSRFLLQKTGLDDPYQGQALDIGLKVRDNIVDNQNMARELAKLTGHTYDKIQRDLSRDFYLSSFEAREYGLVDKVLLPKIKNDLNVITDLNGRRILMEDNNFGSFNDNQDKYQSDAGAGSGYGGKPTAADDDKDVPPPAQV